MVDTVLMDKPYLTQPEVAARLEPLLHAITVEELNRHIQSWFTHSDRIVQYQAPHLTPIAPISVDFVKNLQKQIASSALSPPTITPLPEPMSLAQVNITGSIVAEHHFSAENVRHFSLSNGDRVVWLKTPLAKQKTYFEARSPAGFNAKGLHPWLSQMAVQLIAQNAPLDWEIEQLMRWKTLKKVNLTLNQTAEALHATAVVDNTQFADLLRLYYAYQQETQIKAGIDETKEALGKSLASSQSNEALRQARHRLLFGSTHPYPQRDNTSLNAFSALDLNQTWQTLRQTPVVHYVVNDLSEPEMRALIARFLSGIPRKAGVIASPSLLTEGRETVHFPTHSDPKHNVQMWFFQPHPWQGKEAVLVAMLRTIATNKLKLSLRDQHLGIYSLRFESQLHPDHHRIESQLMFSVDPQKSEAMIALAEKTLQALPTLITEDDVNAAKAQFIAAEKMRQTSPQTWLHRLMLSDKHDQSPRYLNEITNLANVITLENMQNMAKKLYHADNVKVFIETQK